MQNTWTSGPATIWDSLRSRAHVGENITNVGADSGKPPAKSGKFTDTFQHNVKIYKMLEEKEK